MGLLHDLAGFVFPRTCECCGRLLGEQEKVLCIWCRFEIPRTNFHLDPENRLIKMFWGRSKIRQAAGFFHYVRGSYYARLLQKLKYQGRKEIGIELGRLYGLDLAGSEFQQQNLIVPVPLHPSRERKRGYNQSLLIAKGLSETLGIPVETSLLRRTSRTSTQTRRGRFDRFINMEGRFEAVSLETCPKKSLLLVDDVITTGATIEACGICLEEAGFEDIMVLSLGVA